METLSLGRAPAVVVPTDVNSLQSFWGPTRKKHFPTRVVATAPGFDLALGVIDVGEMDPQFRKAFDVWAQAVSKEVANLSQLEIVLLKARYADLGAFRMDKELTREGFNFDTVAVTFPLKK